MSDKIFKCSCGCEGITLQQEDGEINLAVWVQNYGPYNNRPLIERIKMAWRVLKKGHLYTDQMCLSAEEARELCKGLSEKIKEALAEEASFYERCTKKREKNE